MNEKRIYTAVFSALLLAALLFLIPYLQLLVIIIPFAAVFAVAYCGYAVGGVAVAAGFGAGFFFGTELMPAMIAAAFLPLAFAAGYMIREKKRFRNGVIVSCAAALAGSALAILILTQVSGKSIVDFSADYMGSLLQTRGAEEVKLLYSTMRIGDLLSGAVTQAAIDATSASDAIVRMQSILRDVLNLNLVMIIILYSLVLGLLGYLIPRALCKGRGSAVADIPPFSEYTLPKRFWLGAVVSIIFTMIGAGFGWPAFDILQVTIYNVYAFVFIVQGLSLLDYFLKTRNMGKGLRVVLGILAAVLLGMIVLPIVGLIENAFGIRKRIQSRKAV